MDLQIYPAKPRRHWIPRLLFDMMDLWNFTYRHNKKQMITPHAFPLPFGGKLNREKRGCKLAAGMLWNAVEKKYAKGFKHVNVGILRRNVRKMK